MLWKLSSKEKAKNLVASYSLKLEAVNKEEKEKIIAKWEEKAVNDFDGTELMLMSIGTKVKVPVPADKGSKEAVNTEKSAVKLMQEERVKNQEAKRKMWKTPAQA